jgi:hypothetical protein
LKYKTGAIQGKPLKRKVAPEETREWKKQYEKDWTIVNEENSKRIIFFRNTTITVVT